ncbi:MAG: hypothetical protein L6R39_002859, partial [Caloplaca ligustica]
MRSTTRLLAAVKPDRFLTSGNPTGLAGLLTHPAPRSQLLYVYSTTLSKLSELPAHSVYRQSTEAITKHRLSIIQNTKPPGYEEWAQRAQKRVKENPDVFGKDADINSVFVQAVLMNEKEGANVEWDGGKNQPVALEGTRMDNERRVQLRRLERAADTGDDLKDWENEPPLEAWQYVYSTDIADIAATDNISKHCIERMALTMDFRIAEIEDKIGGGLIEEVIQVAEGELKLVDTIREARSWEELEEKPPKGATAKTCAQLLYLMLLQASGITSREINSVIRTPFKPGLDVARGGFEASDKLIYSHLRTYIFIPIMPKKSILFLPEVIKPISKKAPLANGVVPPSEHAGIRIEDCGPRAVEEFVRDFDRREADAKAAKAAEEVSERVHKAVRDRDPELLWDAGLDLMIGCITKAVERNACQPKCLLKAQDEYSPWQQLPRRRKAARKRRRRAPTQAPVTAKENVKPAGDTLSRSSNRSDSTSTTTSPIPKISPPTETTSKREAILRNALLIARDIGSWAKEPGIAYLPHYLVQGVQIACTSAQILQSTPRYTVYETPRRDLLDRFAAPQLSERIGLPLTVFGSNYDIANDRHANPSAEQLYRGEHTCDLEGLADGESCWGSIPLKAKNPGNVLVFRKDGKELLPQH